MQSVADVVASSSLRIWILQNYSNTFQFLYIPETLMRGLTCNELPVGQRL